MNGIGKTIREGLAKAENRIFRQTMPKVGIARRQSGELAMKILLVEDSNFLRIATTKALFQAGYEVSSAANGEEALKLAMENRFDLIVLDMMLPRLSGTEVLRELKKNTLTASVPVIVLTSLAQKNDEKLKKHGAAAYFEKSSLMFDQGPERLLEIVKDALSETKVPY